MKYCTNCGQQLDDSAAFCTNCGMRFEVPQAVAEEVEEMTRAAVPEPEPVQIPQEPVFEAPAEPAYEAPAAPEYQAPAYETPAEPVYQAPVYETPAEPVFQPPVEPVKETKAAKQKKGPWMILTFVMAGVAVLALVAGLLIGAVRTNRVRAELEATQADLSYTQSQLDSAQEERDAAQQEIEDLHAQYDALAGELAMAGSDMDAVSAKLNELEQFITEIRYDTTGYVSHDYMISDGVIVLGVGESKVVDLFSNVEAGYTIRAQGGTATVKFEEASWNQSTTIRIEAVQPGLTIATMTNDANSDVVTILVYVVED